MQLRCSYLPLIIALGSVPVANAQEADCRSVKFSDAVVQRFPRVRDACLEVIQRDGQQWAVFKADLVRTAPSTLYVRFQLPDGAKSGTRTIKVSPSRRVLIDGKPYRVEDLSVGQELTAYVKVTEPVMALAPPASEPLDTGPLPGETQQVASASTGTMPHTASPVREYGVAGLAMLLAGVGIGLLRRFRPRESF